MFKVNEDYLKLPGSYLFSTIGKKVAAYSAANPDKSIIRLGIGDVTQPLAPAIIDALHGAVDEMAHAETFHGYAPDLGYEFLRTAMAKNDYQDRGCDIKADEIFISDGAKGDSGNIQEIFAKDNKIAVCDPVYPVYVDTNVMAGRTGTYDPKTETWSDVIYMPCTKETNFAPELPKETPDIIYLCFPNNPTGSTITKDQLQEWVDYANKVGAVIIYDAAYEAYISEDNVPHTIYERSSFEAFLRMQDLPAYVWGQRLFRRISSRVMLCCTLCGQDVTEPNIMEPRISCRKPARQYTQRLVRFS